MNPVAHLNPATWARANRLLVAKALAEFSHERLLRPALEGSRYVVRSDDGTVEYRFAARILSLDHWHIDAASIARSRGTDELAVDALDLCIELADTLGLTPQILPVYLEEISSTLASIAYKLDRPAATADELADADFQAIETGMTEGHPGFVANSGRIGFGIDDYHAYAPEAANAVRLVWVAAHRDHATFTCGAGLNYDSFIRDELGDETLAAFAGDPRRTRSRPRRPPAHPGPPVAVAQQAVGHLRR